MFRSMRTPIYGIGVSLLLAVTVGCKGSNNSSGSNLDFASEGLFQFHGTSQDELTLHSAPMTSLALDSGRSSFNGVTDYFFRLKFYQVTYASLSAPVNGSTEGDVNGITDIGREVNISRDNILGGSVTITPVFDNGMFLTDGYYVIIMCQNLAPCAPPSAATLSKYKDAFLGGKCGNASKGISAQCYDLLFQDANTSYMGIVYPITVKNKKFTQGDYSLAYNAGAGTGLALAGKDVQSQYVFESTGGGYEPVLQTNGNGQNIYDSLSASGSGGTNGYGTASAGGIPSTNANSSASAGGNPSNGNDNSFWTGVGKALVWLGQNQSSTPDNTAAVNAAAAAKTASTNAAAAQAAGASAAGARSHDCFTAGSRIVVVSFAADGSVSQIGEKPVESLAVGDYVYNPLLRTAAKIKAVFKQGNTDAIYTLTINSTSPQVSQDLTVTAAHPVITKSGLKPVALLTSGDKVMMINKIPVTSQMDYSWFSVQKLLRTSAPDAVTVYNLQIDDSVAPIKIGADPSQPWWYYALSGDTASCPNDGDGCSKYFVSSNQLVTGDLTRQQETEKLMQQAFVRMNNPTN